MSTSRIVGIWTLSVVGGFGLLLALLGLLVGPYTFFVLLGMTSLLLGGVGVLVGREWWALIRSRRVGAVLLAAGVVLTGVGVGLSPPLPDKPETVTSAAGQAPAPSASPTPPTTTDPADALVAAAGPGTALAAVGRLEVKSRAPMNGYTQDQFGLEWADVDSNGCNTRDDILRRDLAGAVTEPGSQGCQILAGELPDPYSGTSIAFPRGAQNAANVVEIDHIVALADAWQKGAQQLDEPTRIAFANDPLNLLATGSILNLQKADFDAASWLPPSNGYRCAFVARQVAVKNAYGLWVTQAERGAMARVLAACPAEPLPVGEAVAPPPARADSIPAQPVRDRDCRDFSTQAEAQAALLPGDPERLDPDGDDLACENYFANPNQPDTYVPVPPASPNDDSSSGGTRPRSGGSGHPCLPGERDGDGDGYCGEG